MRAAHWAVASAGTQQLPLQSTHGRGNEYDRHIIKHHVLSSALKIVKTEFGLNKRRRPVRSVPVYCEITSCFSQCSSVNCPSRCERCECDRRPRFVSFKTNQTWCVSGWAQSVLSWQRCSAVIGRMCAVTLVSTTFSFLSKTKQSSSFCWARTQPNHWAHFEGCSYGNHGWLLTGWLFTCLLFSGQLFTGWLLFGCPMANCLLEDCLPADSLPADYSVVNCSLVTCSLADCFAGWLFFGKLFRS